MGKLPEKKVSGSSDSGGGVQPLVSSTQAGFCPHPEITRNRGLLFWLLLLQSGIPRGRSTAAGLSNTGGLNPRHRNYSGFAFLWIWLCPIITHSAKTAMYLLVFMPSVWQAEA